MERRARHIELIERTLLVLERQTRTCRQRRGEFLGERHVAPVEARYDEALRLGVRDSDGVDRPRRLVKRHRHHVHHLRAYRGEAGAAHLVESVEGFEEEPEVRGGVGLVVFAQDDVAFVLAKRHDGATVKKRPGGEPGQIHREAAVHNRIAHHSAQCSVGDVHALRGRHQEAIGGRVVGEIGDRAVERKHDLHLPLQSQRGHSGERTGSRVGRHSGDIRFLDRPPAAQRHRRGRPFLGGPHPMAGVEREAHRIALAHVGRRTGAGKRLDSIAGSRNQEQPHGQALEGPQRPRGGRGFAVFHRHEQRAHHHHAHPVDEHRPGVGVGTENLGTEALADIAPQVERRMAQSHVDATGGNQDRHADVARARAVTNHEQAGQRHQHHARALCPAEHAG